MAARVMHGRVVEGKLIQCPADGIWREFPRDDFDLDDLPEAQPKPSKKISVHSGPTNEGD